MNIYIKNSEVIYGFKSLSFLTIQSTGLQINRFIQKDKSALLLQPEKKNYKTLRIDNRFKRFKIFEKN